MVLIRLRNQGRIIYCHGICKHDSQKLLVDGGGEALGQKGGGVKGGIKGGRWEAQPTRACPKPHGISSQVPTPHPVGGSLGGGGSQVICAPQQLTLTQPS